MIVTKFNLDNLLVPFRKISEHNFNALMLLRIHKVVNALHYSANKIQLHVAYLSYIIILLLVILSFQKRIFDLRKYFNNSLSNGHDRT